MTTLDVLARTLPSLAMIVGALLVLRHWARRGGGNNNTGVRVLTRTGLAKGAVVAVVAVGERRLLVGASEHGVSLLTELAPDTGTTDATSPPEHDPDELARMLSGVTGVSAAATTDEVAALSSSRFGLRPTAFPWNTDRPRMAPIDHLRHLTVRRAVSSHPRRSTGVKRPT